MVEPTVLGGRYEIGDLLGSGGMAEVHVGRDLRLGRKVAVKMLRPDLARDPSFQARFRREAQSAASLNHPAVVAVYDTGEDAAGDGSVAYAVPYIVMEYVEGSTLRELLTSGRRLLPERAMEIVGGVLEALDYSHRHGIVHRDIKPANVMLTRAGDVKVMDFGIARAVADTSATMTQTSAVIGTAQYLSPEQARGETVDARSDLYSTGCLLYELLTGRPPFIGESPVSVAYQHVREEPVPPSGIDPDVPPAADAVTMKALVKDREHRYQTAAEMRADIQRALAGGTVAAPPPVAGATQTLPPILSDPQPTSTSPGSAGPRQPERRRGAAGYVLLALAVVAVFALAVLAGRELFGESGGERTTVPNVVGLPEERARADIEAEGLRVDDVEQDFSDTVPAGRVISSDPGAGAPVEEGSPVNLVVSEGPEEQEPETVSMPVVEGRPLEEVAAELSQLELRYEVAREPSAQEVDTVLGADQEPNADVPVGTIVSLTVASGENTVPEVLGSSRGDAESVLGDAGFEVRVEEREDEGVDPGTVLDQQPDPGEERRLGTPVTIVVAIAPEPEESPTPVETTDGAEDPTAEPGDGGDGGDGGNGDVGGGDGG